MSVTSSQASRKNEGFRNYFTYKLTSSILIYTKLKGNGTYERHYNFI